MTKETVKRLLEADEKKPRGKGSIYSEIEKEYRIYANFDGEIKSWLNTMYHFGSWGEFYEMVGIFNRRLFN